MLGIKNKGGKEAGIPMKASCTLNPPWGAERHTLVTRMSPTNSTQRTREGRGWVGWFKERGRIPIILLCTWGKSC